jgi:CubicO group peptidase (beta-lactamase class C family)
MIAFVLVLAQAFPGADWDRVAPADAGYSAAKLEALRHWLKAGNTTGMQVVVGGRSLLEHGDVKLVSKVASVRKSILAMLFAKHVAKVDFSRTVVDLGLDDTQPFLPLERRATLYDLITARSGIYLRSHKEEDPGDILMPRRGAYPPGAHFVYHNWDFNAVGTAFEKITGLDLYDALEADLAIPLGMQDFDRKRQKRVSEMPATVHPEFAMHLSTRDMARLGLLMRHKGTWKGKDLIAPQAVEAITRLVTPFRDMNPGSLSSLARAGRWGYGMMWWVWDAPAWNNIVSGPFQGAIAAKGAKGQHIVVLPMLDMVVAHKVDITDNHAPEVTEHEFQTILQMLVAANCGKDSKACW